MLATFALTYIIPEIIRFIFGPENQNMPIPIQGSLSIVLLRFPAMTSS